MLNNDNANRISLAEGLLDDDDDDSGPVAPLGDDTRSKILAVMVAHQRWRRNMTGGKRARLSHHDLSEWVLDGVDFAHADLRGCSLTQARLRQAALQDADLFMADLEDADLREANLRGANLAGARLHRCDLRNAQLEGAILTQGTVTPDVRRLGSATADLPLGNRATELRDANLQHAKLMKADMSGCDLTGANLTGADLRGADLKGSILIDANLEDVDLDGAQLEGAYTFGVQASGETAELLQSVGTAAARPVDDLEDLLRLHAEWVDSNGEAGTQIDLDGSDLSGRSMVGAKLQQARFRRCCMTGVDLTDADLELADLSWSELSNSKLRRANLSGTTLRSCTLVDTDLSGTRLLPVDIGGAGSKPWPTNMENASAHNARFIGAQIRQAVLRDVKVTPQTLKDLSDAGVPAMVLRKLIVEQA